MGLFNKIKEALFDDVEDEVVVPAPKPTKEEAKVTEKTEPQITKEEKPRPVETPRFEAPKKDSELKVSEEKQRAEKNINDVNEINLYKSNDSFPFLDFDEEEFSSMSRQSRQNTNVLEYEKKRKTEKKYDFGKYERVETREIVEKKKFKPSPIISPVYGILNEDYKIEDIKDKTAENKEKNLDFNAIRKKAFGNIETIEEKKSPKESYYEETVTVKFKENDNEREKKVKAIDELLEDSADLKISSPEEVIVNKPRVEPKIDNPDDYEKVDSDLEEIIEPKNNEKLEKNTEFDNDDTLESDLFDLIDSMYDNREEGE